MRVDLQPAYVLHTRPYQDSSLLVTIFSLDYGRLTLVAKGVRKSKQRQRQWLQPFIPLQLSWQGKSTLKTLIAIEHKGALSPLVDKYLYSGFYINGLLIYLLPEEDNSPELFERYQYLVEQLRQQMDLEYCLRLFEFDLLAELGYGIDFTHDATSQATIDSTHSYYFIPDTGFTLVNSPLEDSGHFAGEHLLAIANQDYQNPLVRIAAKRITRMALDFYLQGKPIKSRELFKA